MVEPRKPCERHSGAGTAEIKECCIFLECAAVVAIGVAGVFLQRIVKFLRWASDHDFLRLDALAFRCTCV